MLLQGAAWGVVIVLMAAVTQLAFKRRLGHNLSCDPETRTELVKAIAQTLLAFAGICPTCVWFKQHEGCRQTDEKVRPVNKKHIQYSVCKLGGDGVKGVDKERDDPLVTHGCADVHAVGHVVRVQARVDELDDG
jgi:hypothetical protein